MSAVVDKIRASLSWRARNGRKAEHIVLKRTRAVELLVEVAHMEAEIARLRGPAERYWEARWRDEAAENDRLRKMLDSCVEVMEFAYMNAPEQPKEIAAARALLGIGDDG